MAGVNLARRLGAWRDPVFLFVLSCKEKANRHGSQQEGNQKKESFHNLRGSGFQKSFTSRSGKQRSRGRAHAQDLQGNPGQHLLAPGAFANFGQLKIK